MVTESPSLVDTPSPKINDELDESFAGLGLDSLHPASNATLAKNINIELRKVFSKRGIQAENGRIDQGRARDQPLKKEAY